MNAPRVQRVMASRAMGGSVLDALRDLGGINRVAEKALDETFARELEARVTPDNPTPADPEAP